MAKPTQTTNPPPAAAAIHRANRIFHKLEKLHPDATCALGFANAWELLVATILSAQCTDARVNLVTPQLFEQYPGPPVMAEAKQEDIEHLIRSTGFFRNKAKSIIAAAQRIIEDYRGEVPRTMQELLTLPGVARKTANVVLGNAFHINEGIPVDTHVTRLSQRLQLSSHKDPVKIERDLMALYPRDAWCRVSHALIFHGRRACTARKPDCDRCGLKKDCCRVNTST